MSGNNVIKGGISDKTIYMVKDPGKEVLEKYGGLIYFLGQSPPGSLVMLTDIAGSEGAVEVKMKGSRPVLTGKSPYFASYLFFDHVLESTDL